MPRTGPCSPWIQASDVLALPSVQRAITQGTFDLDSPEAQAVAADACAAASEILYMRSGRVYTGACGPVTVRPVARPPVGNERALTGLGSAYGSSASWGSCSWYGLGANGVALHYGDSTPPEIPLYDYPIREIVEVKIDGVVIPADEYELRNHKTLVRMLPTFDAQPTERWGWPTSQANYLPDTQMGTFSITYTYGQDPGAGGRKAALALAEYLVLPDFGDPGHFPARVTSVSRQGVSATVADVTDIMNKGQLGIKAVDLWLMAVNPTKAQRQAVAWSPDVGRPRRAARPTTS